MNYKNVSEDTLIIPGVGTINPSDEFDTELQISDERLLQVNSEDKTEYVSRKKSKK